MLAMQVSSSNSGVRQQMYEPATSSHSHSGAHCVVLKGKYALKVLALDMQVSLSC